jgi:ABC-2 type transport system permease protein
MNLKLFKTLISQSFQEMLSYKATSFFIVIFGLMFLGLEFLATFVYYSITDNIMGWSKLEFLLLIVTVSIIESGYQFLFISSHENLADSIIEGELDYVFLRPVNSFFFYSFYRIDIPSIINLSISVVVSIILFAKLNINILYMPIYLLFILLGIWFTYLINQLIITLSFWFDNASSILAVPEYIMDFSSKPKSIFPRIVRHIFIWIFPSLLATNSAVDIVSGRGNIFELMWYIVFLIGLTILVYKFWFIGIKKYQSANCTNSRGC